MQRVDPVNPNALGLSARVPAGWSRVAYRRPAGAADPDARGVTVSEGDRTYPVLHLATRPWVGDLGDFGSGIWADLAPADAFVALVEYDPALADVGLFAAQGVPVLAPSGFGEERLPRRIPGRSGSQKFFSSGGRAFCLFVVIGEQSRRMATVPMVNEVVQTIDIEGLKALQQKGLRP